MDFLPDGTFRIEDPAALKIPTRASGAGTASVLQGPGSRRRIQANSESYPFLDDGGLRVNDDAALQVPDLNRWEPSLAAGPGSTSRFELEPIASIGMAPRTTGWDWMQPGFFTEPWMQTMAQDLHEWEKIGKSWDWMAECCGGCGVMSASARGASAPNGANSTTVSLPKPLMSWFDPGDWSVWKLIPRDVRDTLHAMWFILSHLCPPENELPSGAEDLVFRDTQTCRLWVVGKRWSKAGQDHMCFYLRHREVPLEDYNCWGWAFGIAEWPKEKGLALGAKLQRRCKKVKDCKKDCPTKMPTKVIFAAYDNTYTHRDSRGSVLDRRDWEDNYHIVRVEPDGSVTSKNGGRPPRRVEGQGTQTTLPEFKQETKDGQPTGNWVGDSSLDWRGEKFANKYTQSPAQHDVSGCYCCPKTV